MYERFTDRSRNVMMLANIEAQRLNHEYIGTEHILLGLIADASNELAPPPPNEQAVGRIGAFLRVVLSPLDRLTDWLFDRLQNPALRGPLSPDFVSARAILKNLQIDGRAVRREVLKMIQSGPDKSTTGRLPETPRAKKVIEYALDEVHRCEHHALTTGHLLLGLLREREGIAAQVLEQMGVTIEKVRDEFRRITPA
jgi:ATP-dependent Clp protease ATP-binding subunit ClpC